RSELPAIVVCVIRPWLGLRCRLRETRAGGDGSGARHRADKEGTSGLVVVALHDRLPAFPCTASLWLSRELRKPNMEWSAEQDCDRAASTRLYRTASQSCGPDNLRLPRRHQTEAPSTRHA